MAPTGEVGTIATGRAVGTLAFASVLYRPHDAAFAERSLKAARAGYRFLRDRPAEDSDGPTCPAMRQDGDPSVGRDVRMYAAAGLLLATGDRRLRVDFEESCQPLQNDPSGYRSNVYAALLYLRASAGDPERQRAVRRELRRRAEEVRLDGERHPFQWAGRTFWGSIAAGFQRTAGFSAQTCLEDPVGAAADCEQVLANVHHALGRNYRRWPTWAACPASPAAGSTPSITSWRRSTPGRSSFPGWWLEAPSRHRNRATSPCRTAAPFRSGATGAIPPCHAMPRRHLRGATPTTTAGPPMSSTSTGKA